MKNKYPSADDLKRLKANPEVLYQELNLVKVEGYTFSFDPKAIHSQESYVFTDYLNDPEGKIKERPVIIEPHPNYGRPSTLAYTLLNALFKKLSEYGLTIPDTIPFTFRELGKRIGRDKFGGKDALEIFNALKQIQTTSITCWGYNKAEKKWANINFYIITDIAVSGTTGRLAEGFVRIHPIIVTNLERSYHRSINYARMQFLSPIATALYKQIYNVFSTRYSHNQHPTFAKNYENICVDWLGGISVQKHKSRILQQLSPHFEALRSVRLIKGAKIEKNSTNGWKFTFSPGSGFKEDYDNFYKKSRQHNIQFEYHDDKNTIQDPIDLVAHFYATLYGDTNTADSIFSKKETALAKEVLSSLPINEAKDFVEFAIAEASATQFDIKTFGAVRQYLPAWSKEKKKITAKKEADERSMREKTEEALKSEYDAYVKEEYSRLKDTMPKEKLSSFEKLAHDEVYKNDQPRLGAEMLIRIKVNRFIAEEFDVMSFKEWGENNVAIKQECSISNMQN